MEPNPQFVRQLTQKLQRFNVDDEAVFWAIRDLIQSGTPLLKKDAE
jgi:hypothetical protein